jgi:hypothetical protein|tara:strand:- start:481 stop:834 length:354 start_codon:yes stop_codon:yes gene_type:complete
MKYINLITSLIIGLLAISCTKNPPLKIGNGEDVIVTLEITDPENLVDISFSSNKIDTILYPQDLKSKSIIHFKFNLQTDKSYYIGAITKTDTFGILASVQSGYRPNFILDSDTLKSN